MGCIETISLEKFPIQGNKLAKNVEVCFHYDTSKTIAGVVVRDDEEEPFRTIIRLDDGRFVLGTECMYREV